MVGVENTFSVRKEIWVQKKLLNITQRKGLEGVDFSNKILVNHVNSEVLGFYEVVD